MSDNSLCPCDILCPLQKAMDSIGGKWKMPILCSLSMNGPTRFNELRRAMQGISNTMLAKALKELEVDGLIKRTEHLEVPVKVVYETTDAVDKLNPIMIQLAKWGTTLGKR